MTKINNSKLIQKYKILKTVIMIVLLIAAFNLFIVELCNIYRV